MKTLKLEVKGKRKVKGVSEFMKAMDLGIEGIYKSFRDIVSGEVHDTFNQPEVDNAIEKIKACYEENGCIDIEIKLLSLTMISEA